MPTLNIWHYVSLIAIAVILMGIGGAIDHHLYATPIRDELNQKKGADTQASNDAKQAVVKQEQSQNEATQSSLTYWKSRADNLDAALERMRNQPAKNNEHLPSASDRSGSIYETIGQYSRFRASNVIQPCLGSSADPCSVSRKFYENALDDADMLNNGWQDWAKRQGFPVK